MSQEKLHTVSVIVPTYRLLPCLSECIESVKANSTQNIQLIVVDNSPEFDDGTKSYCKNFEEITYIESDHNSFSHAINLGIKESVGDFIVWLNNDTIVPPRWDIRLIEGMTQAEKFLGIDNVHLIGPLSNEAAGMQRLQAQIDYNTSNLFQFCEQMYDGNKKEGFEMTGFLSGFCLMHTREVIDDIGILDERFGEKAHGGFEDNDFVSRALLAGYRAVAYAGVFVHHQGSRTFKRFFLDDRLGLVNRLTYLKKWKEEFKDKTRLGIVYRVRISNERHMDYFLRSIRKSAEVGDCIAIFNDKSEVDDFHERVAAEVQQSRAIELKIEDKKDDEFNERDDRNRAIDLCREMNPDWIFALDHDETLEDGLTRKALERLMKGPDPVIKAFGFHFCTFHDHLGQFRKDGIMGGMFGHRMFRNVPGTKIIGGNKLGLHCGNIAKFADDEKVGTSYRIMHFGYVEKKEDRERKREYYNGLDTDKNEKMIGGDNYDHVADENGLKLCSYVDDNAASLCMIVRDEENFIGTCMQRQWHWYDEIIIVDTGSTDETIEICKCFTDKVFDFTKRDRFFNKKGMLVDFSAPRNFSIEQATNRWIWILDADEFIVNSELVRHMMDEISIPGYVHMIKNVQMDNSYNISESVRSFRRDIDDFKFSGRIHETIDRAALETHKCVMVQQLNHINEGFLKGDVRIQEKLVHYLELLLTEIQEDPSNAKAFFALGSHFANRNKLGDAEWAFARSISLHPTFYPPRRDLAFLYLRKAKGLLTEARNGVPDDHPFKNAANHIIKFIGDNCSQTRIGKPDEMTDWDVHMFRQITGILDKLSAPELQSDRLEEDQNTQAMLPESTEQLAAS